MGQDSGGEEENFYSLIIETYLAIFLKTVGGNLNRKEPGSMGNHQQFGGWRGSMGGLRQVSAPRG